MKIKLWLIVISLVLQGCTYEAYNAVKPEPKAPDFVGSFIQFRILSALVSGSGTNSGGELGCSNSSKKTVTISTFAGSGSVGSIDGTGTAASFNNSQGIAIDSSGTFYVTENYKIRKITSAGVVSTLAGSGSSGSTDGIATAASFNLLRGIAVDSSGTLYVADAFNNKIRKITSAGVVSTLAGSGSSGSTDGIGTVASFNIPLAVAVDSSGIVYVVDQYSNKIRKITSAGVVSTLAGSGSNGSIDGVGTSASFSGLQGIVIDNNSNIYVTDSSNNKIRKITTEGVVTTFAGSGSLSATDGTGTAASLGRPVEMAIDSNGNIFVMEQFSIKLRKVTSSAVVTTIINDYSLSSNYPYGLAIDSKGAIYGTASNKILKIVCN